MKTFLMLLITLFAFATSALAQDNPSPKFKKNSLKYGYGTTFHSNGMLGTFQYGELTRSFGKRIALSGLAGYLNAEQGTEVGITSGFKALKGDATLYILPINNSRNSFKIGGGASYWKGKFKSRDSLEVDFTEVDEENYGWNATAEYEVFIGNTVTLGAKGAYTQAPNKENYFFFGLNAGFKF